MQLSTRGRYAVMAMVDLASRQSLGCECGPVCLAEIAASQQLSLSYLEQLFARLRRCGLVTSARGPGGGYRLARDSDCISIAEGNSCSLCGFDCPSAAINVAGYGKYLADIAYTTADLSGQRQACSNVCMVKTAPCCAGGTCQACPVVIVHPDDGGDE